MKDVVLFGTGAMAEVIEVYLRAYSDLRIVGYTLDAAFRQEERRGGLPVVPWEGLEAVFPPDQVLLLGPLTYRRMNRIRRDRYLEGKARGYGFASFLHPGAHILGAEIGENCVVLEGNVIQPFVRIGPNCIIWSQNQIGHHATIGAHSFIASMVAIAGHVEIGEESYIGGQTGIVHGVTLGRACATLNGAVVAKDLPDGTVVAGAASPVKPFPSSRLRGLI
ncbi:acetyltransferase [Pseudoroseicyclus sp. CXY001]|uniref:acetyltransferase n=1 Tax=Pseudoroseicyclus sp. CXY001 TaxID=3242492 RepID=UPI003570C579